MRTTFNFTGIIEKITDVSTDKIAKVNILLETQTSVWKENRFETKPIFLSCLAVGKTAELILKKFKVMNIVCCNIEPVSRNYEKDGKEIWINEFVILNIEDVHTFIPTYNNKIIDKEIKKAIEQNKQDQNDDLPF